MLLKLFWDISFSLLGYLAVNRLANCFSLAKILSYVTGSLCSYLGGFRLAESRSALKLN